MNYDGSNPSINLLIRKDYYASAQLDLKYSQDIIAACAVKYLIPLSNDYWHTLQLVFLQQQLYGWF